MLGMRKVWDFAVREKNKLWFSACINLLGLMFLVLVMKPCFEMNDDSTIYELTSGAKGVYDSHTVFIHIFIGSILKLLYALLPGIQWYTVLQYFLLFCSFCAVYYILMNRMRASMALLSFGTLFFYFGYEGYIALQFSKTAGIAACAGILLMFYGLEGKKKNWLCVVIGIFLALAGGMYRYKEFLMCSAIMSAIGVYALINIRWKKPKEFLTAMAPYAGSFLILFASFGGLILFNNAAYGRSQEWEEYIRYNDSRSSLMDYGFPDYNTYQEEYEKLGLSKEDIELYISCNYADPDLFSQETIDTLLSLRPQREINRGFVKEYFDTFPMGFFKIYVFTCFLLFCFYWLFFGKKTWREWAVLLYGAAVTGGVYAYLFYIGRYLVSRTETAFWFGACLLVVWMMDQKKRYFDCRTAAAFCACAAVFNLPSWKEQMRTEKAKISAQMEVNQGYLNLAGRDREHLYLAKINTLTTFYAYGPFDAIPFDSLENICKLGGWEAGNPLIEEIQSTYGVSNPYRDMINNPRVIVVDDKVNDTLRYLRDHYDSQVKAYKIKEINGQNFYVYRSEPFLIDASKIQNPDDTVHCSFDLKWGTDKLSIQGNAWQENTNSYTQRVYAAVTDTENGNTQYYPLAIKQAEGVEDLMNGRFGSFSGSISLKNAGISKERYEQGNCRIEIVLENEKGIWGGK